MSCATLIWALFSMSGRFAALRMAVLFCWHVQHRSDIGFMIMIDGNKDFQVLLKVEYAKV